MTNIEYFQEYVTNNFVQDNTDTEVTTVVLPANNQQSGGCIIQYYPDF